MAPHSRSRFAGTNGDRYRWQRHGGRHGQGPLLCSRRLGKSLTNADTNNPIELFPGSFIVELNGTTQPITRSARRNGDRHFGSAMVASTGRAVTGDASARADERHGANNPIELFDYVN